MKATEAKFLDFLKKSLQFVTPISRRTYSWIEPQYKHLWDDRCCAREGFHLAAHKTFNQPVSRSGDGAARRLYE